MVWKETESYLSRISNHLDELLDPTRIAGFDLDDTLISYPKGRKNFKWSLLDPLVPHHIGDLIDKNYLIVIFTNQAGMGTGKKFDKEVWKIKIDELFQVLVSEVRNQKYYLAIYAAKTYDLYRKPNLGMWSQMKMDLEEEFGLSKSVRISTKSFFCGDAAGRLSGGIYKKKVHPSSYKGDFSDVDRKFALNIGIKFFTPEEFLMDTTPDTNYRLSGIDPKEIIRMAEKSDQTYHFEPRQKEMIILSGYPGSGKTEFYQKYLQNHGYVHVNQDICKTREACLTITQDALKKGKSVVIDGTNPDIPTRNRYITLAQSYGYQHIRAIIINTNPDVASHLNNVRHVLSKGQIPKVNKIVYHLFKGKYVKPKLSEHFDKIETVDFVFDTRYLQDPVWKKIFLLFSE